MKYPLSQPYQQGDDWYIQVDEETEIKFVSFEEAWEYYESHNNDD